MIDSVEITLKRLVARGGPPFHEMPNKRGLRTLINRLFGKASKTHYYERLDGSRIPLTKEEASEIPPIELEMFPEKVARRLMLERRERRVA